MKKIIIPNYDKFTDAATWIKENELDIINNESLTIDLSECFEIHSCIVGFVIYLLTYFYKKNSMCSVIRPTSILMKSVFEGIFEYFGV